MISTFDLFKIGIGPSSSHTVGPMVAARRFRETVLARGGAARISAEIYGSLAWTGRGHGTDVAILLGLLGHAPATIDPDLTTPLSDTLRRTGDLGIPGVHFEPERDLVFNFKDILPLHTNGMRFRAYDAGDALLEDQIFYSVGGGFVVTAAEAEAVSAGDTQTPPLPFGSGRELLDLTLRTGLTIPQIQLANELTLRSREAIDAGLDAIRDAMFACIERGLRMDGELPGGLRVRRRRGSARSRPCRAGCGWRCPAGRRSPTGRAGSRH
jgi:L-serine dehydratase